MTVVLRRSELLGALAEIALGAPRQRKAGEIAGLERDVAGRTERGGLSSLLLSVSVALGLWPRRALFRRSHSDSVEDFWD